MSNLVNEFILRRTNTLNAQHLPAKLVQVRVVEVTWASGGSAWDISSDSN